MLRRESFGAEVSQWFTAGSQTLQVDRLHLHLSADKKGNVVSLRGSYSSTSNHEGAFREMKQKDTTNNVCNKCRMDYWMLFVCMYVCTGEEARTLPRPLVQVLDNLSVDFSFPFGRWNEDEVIKLEISPHQTSMQQSTFSPAY